MAHSNNNASGSGSNTNKKSPPLNKAEEEVLLAQLDKWHSSSKDERRVILKASISDAKLVAPKMDAHLLKERRTVCHFITLLSSSIVHPDRSFCAPDI